MSYLLRAFGHAVVATRDGHEGLRLACLDDVDLVLCDIQLPGIGGIEIASRIRGDVAFDGLPLVAVTALAMVGDRETIMSAGFDGYIAKPIEPTSFVPQIEAFLPPEKRGLAPAGAASVDNEKRSGPRGRRVLVVDDRPINLDLARGILCGSDYEMVAASSMAEALRLARDLVPDLILSDVCMADGSGYDFIRAVKADSRLREIPFIFLTSTMTTESERSKGLALGAARFLFRPIEPPELLREIAACLGHAKRS